VTDDRRLSPGQVEQVLRRAARLDTEAGDEAQGERGDGVTGDELVRLGEEAGLSRAALDTALAELRRGELLANNETGLAQALGSGRVVLGRDLPLPVSRVKAALARFMREQLMIVRRDQGDRIHWEKAKGLFPGLARSLDFGQRYCFGPVETVETLLVPRGPNAASLTFVVDLTQARRERFWSVGLRCLAYAGLGGLVGYLFEFGGFGLSATALGAAAAAATWIGERRRYKALQERVAIGPERFLDSVTQNQTAGRPAAQDGVSASIVEVAQFASDAAADLAESAVTPRSSETSDLARSIDSSVSEVQSEKQPDTGQKDR